MKIVIIALVASYIGFLLYARKYNNPYKLIFLFGKKGSGKSTYMVKLMLQDIKKGWTVYTNMSDVNIKGVRIFTADDLKSFRPEEHSSLYIDEAGLEWDNRNFKNFDKGLTEFFKLQRKYHCKMLINSQSYDVDKKIRDLTDSMALQSNLFNIIGITRPILRKVALTEASSDHDSRIADNLKFASIWNYKFTILPRYFKYFDSFSAPDRPYLNFTEVGKDLKEKSVTKAIKINLQN